MDNIEETCATFASRALDLPEPLKTTQKAVLSLLEQKTILLRLPHENKTEFALLASILLDCRNKKTVMLTYCIVFYIYLFENKEVNKLYLLLLRHLFRSGPSLQLYMPAAIAEKVNPGINPYGKAKKHREMEENDKETAVAEWIDRHGLERKVGIGLQACQISWEDYDGEHFYEAGTPWWRCFFRNLASANERLMNENNLFMIQDYS